jgi:hypothetical protein
MAEFEIEKHAAKHNRLSKRTHLTLDDLNTYLEEFEIEKHVAKHNRFFKQTQLTLDDLDTYSKPFGDLLWAVMRLSTGSVTVLEALKVMRRAASDLRAINKRIAKKYAA